MSGGHSGPNDVTDSFYAAYGDVGLESNAMGWGRAGSQE